tara:strand:+ start:476 stop:1888 length:1413 start_codon:yes stop_codon:yes gene_type:complete
MATEGNMSTLDYIPGSNFLGIIAGDIYKYQSPEAAYDILHSDKVSFGDAIISDAVGNTASYTVPFSLFKDKTKKDRTWVHHALNDAIFEELRTKGVQLKQERSGFITQDGQWIKGARKSFALKSAQDRQERRSKDGAMFGFESIEKGQVFLFSIIHKDSTYIDVVNKYLEGIKYIGKSKTAQYGQVTIEKLKSKTITVPSETENHQNFTLVYAESNLCFFNEYGQSTFQPLATDLGFETGEICWEKSQIRTYSYSPWNAKRNTPNTQRDCILKGSVFYVNQPTHQTEDSSLQVGEYTAEGLGRVIYNPTFLKADAETAIWDFEFKSDNNECLNTKTPIFRDSKTKLAQFLNEQKKSKDQELALSKGVQDALKNASIDLKKISPSQWGGIRAYASNETDAQTLRKILFVNFLKHGVAYEKYWGKKNEKNLRDFEKIFDSNIQHGTIFIAKFAAEMAKEAQKLKSKSNEINP